MTLSADSLYTFAMFPHVFSTSSSPSSALKRFLSSIVNFFGTFGARSLLMSNTLRHCLLLGVALSFSLILAITRWWSLPTSAPLCTLKSRRNCCHFLLTMTWPIWLTECQSGDLQLSLWMSLWGRMVPPILHLLMQKSTSLSPL